MLSFESDYIAGAHPEILRRLAETNLESLSGYGTDRYCERAKEKIRKACGLKDAQVELLTGGTQTNAIVISSMLKDHEGVIAAETGHVNVHEAGAIEYTGHKVLAISEQDSWGMTDEVQAETEKANCVPTDAVQVEAEKVSHVPADAGKKGKISADGLRRYLETFYGDETHEHMVYPGMVYLSYPTEYGTLYSLKELEEIADICRQYEMLLYVDGARLGYGLMSREADLTLEELARICDVFYIGGTKVGALCGEAVVFTKGNRPAHFVNFIKKRGALLAKGRLLGVQFDTLFTEDLYFRIGAYAIDMAERLKEIFRSRGYEFFLESPTNQQFIILDNEEMERLKDHVAFSFWEKLDETHTVVRFATSWSTTEEDLRQLEGLLTAH